ncbi:YcjF family protein [Roseovarius tibetensis]|uniref:YcjF family protein n=1 Tax=Roseovarius tibetensis TaxID=2685897 RepID=UPI003D7FCAA5
MSRGPVLIDMDADDTAAPDRAPPVPDDAAPPEGRAMQAAMAHAARPPSPLARLFWGLVLGLLGTAVTVAAWDFAASLISRAPLLGYAVAVMGGALVVVAAIIALREMAAFARLNRLDSLRSAAEGAIADEDLGTARTTVARLRTLYQARAELRWNHARLKDREAEQLDPASLLELAETELLSPLDVQATREIELAARQVATVTALVPLALADVVGALLINLRMIRRIAEIYGGRAGVLGGWRLTRSVMAHLVATGAVAVGDDMISSVAGGNMLSKVSRRFGEGVVNGALTARVGVATIEVCRPMPFLRAARPSVTGMVKRALTGLFARKS